MKSNDTLMSNVRRASLFVTALGLLLVGSGCGNEVENREKTFWPAGHVLSKTESGELIFPEECTVDRSCGGMLAIDCKQAVDGPYYYVEAASGRVVATCGGACLSGPQPEEGICVECPPKEWSCK